VNYEAELRNAIARTLAVVVKAHSLPPVCVQLGLEDGEGAEAFAGKERYVQRRLADKSLTDLLKVGDEVVRAYENHKLHAFQLRETVRLARVNGKRRISEITRTKLFDELLLMGSLEGKLDLDNFLRRLWPIDEMPSSDFRHTTFAGDLWQHMVINSDWSQYELLSRLGAVELSDEAFTELLELLVHPTVRQEEQQAQWLEVINKHLRRDGFIFAEADKISGYPVYRLRPMDVGVVGTPKNLIFASIGPKPEIVLTDAIHNDLRVVKNGEHCLFYDEAIPERGLLWRDLIIWWATSQGLDAAAIETERSLYRRLARSLAPESPPEHWLFESYFEFRSVLEHRLPALIPQVYLHYDPKTFEELYGQKRLPRQRMDFLILLGHGRRIVIEIDGAQHYSTDGRPAPRLYAEMAEADRQLRLCGYEVYRFGGAEFPDKDKARTVARSFFEQLFRKHQIQ
jgi:very-short-patch-repair endonuclease